MCISALKDNSRYKYKRVKKFILHTSNVYTYEENISI